MLFIAVSLDAYSQSKVRMVNDLPEKFVANKGISVPDAGFFNGIFRIKFRLKLGYISIEGKRYKVNKYVQNTHFNNSDYNYIFYVTEILPEYAVDTRTPRNFIFTFCGCLEPVNNETFELSIYDENKKRYVTYMSKHYKVEKGNDGYWYCLDCYPDIFDEF
jgi:hypothetical protein